MGSIMDQERPWERKEEKIAPDLRTIRKSTCDHDWKDMFKFVYDYHHQKCTKCGKKRMF